MVDINATSDIGMAAVREAATRIEVRMHAGREAALAAIDALPSGFVSTGYQHPDFLRAWIAHAGNEPVFLTFTPEGYGPVLLPLERAGGKILGYAGNRHANGNFPLGRPADITALADAGEAAIVAAMRAAGTDAAAIVLERQLETYAGVRNPFIFDRSTFSPNPALALSLDGGFDDLLTRHNRKKRSSRFRNRERRTADLGGYQYTPAVPAEAVGEIMQRFFELKSEQFAALGIHDVFADKGTQDFFVELFQNGAAEDPHRQVLKVIEIEGKPIAISGFTVHDGRMTVEFGVYDPEYARFSPGDMLYYLAVRDATESGLDYFDFGIGDEPYKREWCEIEIHHRDTVIPLTMSGKAITWAKSTRNSLVRRLKANRRLWAAAKRIRRSIPILR